MYTQRTYTYIHEHMRLNKGKAGLVRQEGRRRRGGPGICAYVCCGVCVNNALVLYVFAVALTMAGCVVT